MMVTLIPKASYKLVFFPNLPALASGGCREPFEMGSDHYFYIVCLGTPCTHHPQEATTGAGKLGAKCFCPWQWCSSGDHVTALAPTMQGAWGHLQVNVLIQYFIS